MTIFHELGHNLYLWHSGVPARFGNAGQATVIEANCKPNLVTSMNYLYQHQGLFDQFGHIQLDFSSGALPVLHENALSDGASLATPPYRRAWYAPFYQLDGNGNPKIDPITKQKIISPLVASQGAAKATRFCGKSFGAGDPLTDMARVESPSLDGWDIDWDGDGQPDNPSPAQDVNFDGLVRASRLRIVTPLPDTTTGRTFDWTRSARRS